MRQFYGERGHHEFARESCREEFITQCRFHSTASLRELEIRYAISGGVPTRLDESNVGHN
jgi:hypothetical protein